MFKLAAFGFANLALAQTWTCVTGTDEVFPYGLPSGTSAGCKYCFASELNGTFEWGCVLPEEVSTEILTTSFTNGMACVTGEANLKNYMTKEQASAILEFIEEGIEQAGVSMTLDQALQTYFNSKFYVCHAKNSCNNFVSIADACKGASTIVYDPAKDNGAFGSGADILIAAAQLTVMASLLLVAY